MSDFIEIIKKAAKIGFVAVGACACVAAVVAPIICAGTTGNIWLLLWAVPSLGVAVFLTSIAIQLADLEDY